MRSLRRLIFRLDFPTNYGLIDSPGSIIEILDNVPDNFWDRLGDGRVAHSIAGQFTDPAEYRNLSIEPQSINGSLEFRTGWDMSKIQRNPAFIEFSRLVERLTVQFGVETINRYGIRFFVCESFGDKFESHFQNFHDFFSKEFKNNVESAIGSTSDLGVILEGETESSINYRIHFGPYAENDEIKFLANLPITEIEQEGENEPFHLTADIDLYEYDFSLAGRTLDKWSRTKLELAGSFLDSVGYQLQRV